MGCLPSGLELYPYTYLNEDEDKTANRGDVTMKTCQVCVQSFTSGKKDCCSLDCYLQVLQTRLDECFRNDNSHTRLLTGLANGNEIQWN